MKMGTKCSCFWAILLSILLVPSFLQALTVHEIRDLRSKHYLSCLLVFGDSSVDPGNNNHITTTTRSNFPPYGMDFIGARPTGRFSNGKLGTDFIAEALGVGVAIEAFLDPNITKNDILHAISFSSAGSGYDELTANLSGTISLSRQVNYLMHYKIHLRQFVGYKMANKIVRKAVFLLSMGTNDYIENYYLEPTRSKQFTMDKYEDYLVSRMRLAIEDMHKIGAKRIVVVGLPPIGCMPLVMTYLGDGKHCIDKVNLAAKSLNSKIQKELDYIDTHLKLKTFYGDAYQIIDTTINSPKKHGFSEAKKGCCGSGTFELGDTCKSATTCKDPDKYVFWDSVHPSQMMYKILAEEILKMLPFRFFI